MAVPKEISKNLEDFKAALCDVEDVFEPLNSVSLADINAKLDVLDRAKLQLVFAYSINSFFWMYLCTQGVDPRNHPIKQELVLEKYIYRCWGDKTLYLKNVRRSGEQKNMADKHYNQWDRLSFDMPCGFTFWGRIQKYMARVKQIADKKKAARLDTDAAKRFVRNALWENEPSKDQSQATKRKVEDEQAGPSKKSR